MSDFIVNNTLKPAITIETIPLSTTLPYVSEKTLNDAYAETYQLPYAYMKLALSKGYFKYRLYVGEKYVRDFREKVYADALAKKLGGIVIEGKGTPLLYYPGGVSREMFLSRLMACSISEAEIDLTNSELFIDSRDPFVNYAKSKNIINGFNQYFNPKRPITYLESGIMLYNLDRALDMEIEPKEIEQETLTQLEKLPSWAFMQVTYCIANDYFEVPKSYTGYISQKEFDEILARYQERIFLKGM